MMDHLRVTFDEHEETAIAVEVFLPCDDEPGYQDELQGMLRGAVRTAHHGSLKLDDHATRRAFRMIYQVARQNARMMTALQEAPRGVSMPLRGGEIQFAVKFDGHGAPILSSTMEGNFQVKLVWGNP